MIGRSVAFDREHVAPWLIGMADGKIDLEAGGPNLFVDLVAEALHEGGDGLLERRVRVFGRRDALL